MNSTRGNLRFNKVIEILICFGRLGVLGLNVLLLRQNQSLQNTLAPQIAAGAHLERLAGLALDGRIAPATLPSPGFQLLIITFSPDCPACQANQERWTQLTGILRQKGVRVLWVSRDPADITKDYCLKHGIPMFDVLADPPHRTYVQLGLARVPNTVLVGAEGKVEKVWAGRLDQEGWNTMFAYLGELEGIASPAQVEVGARTTDCGSELSQKPVKSCK